MISFLLFLRMLLLNDNSIFDSKYERIRKGIEAYDMGSYFKIGQNALRHNNAKKQNQVL